MGRQILTGDEVMKRFAAVAAMAAMTVAVPAVAKPKVRAGAQPGELILYQQADFAGDYYTVDSNRSTLQTDWNIRSIAIHEGDKWQICAKPRFRDCIDLTQSYTDASSIGVNGQIGSIRKAPTQ
jgi:hypothetical protein